MKQLQARKLHWRIEDIFTAGDGQPTLSPDYRQWMVCVTIAGVEEHDVDAAVKWATAALGAVSRHEWSPPDPYAYHDCPDCTCESYPALDVVVPALGRNVIEAKTAIRRGVRFPETDRELEAVAA